MGGRWWDCIALELQITLGEGICPKLFWAGPFQRWTYKQSVGQTVLWHSPYGKAGLPPTNIKGCQGFYLCRKNVDAHTIVMTAHWSWTTTEAEGKWRTHWDRCKPSWHKEVLTLFLKLPFDDFGPPSVPKAPSIQKPADLRQRLFPCVWRPPTCCKAAKRCWHFLQSWQCGWEAFSWPWNVLRAPSICRELGAVTEDGAARFKTLMRFNIWDHCNNECLC